MDIITLIKVLVSGLLDAVCVKYSLALFLIY